MRGGLLVLACIALAACDEKLSDVTGPTPELQPTFTSIQSQIFEASDSSGRTACVSCHAPGRIAAFMDLTRGAAYDSLVNRPSIQKTGAIRVIPGDPDNSYLIHKLEGRPDIVGARMPQNGPPFLTDGQIAVIRQWIANGAANN